jgi:hypothetical protein
MGACTSTSKQGKEKNINSNTNHTDHSEFDNIFFHDMPEWEGDRFKGEGIKKMKGYRCEIPINELNKIREEFWLNKQKSGIIWKTIRQACVMDDIRAESIIKSIGLKPAAGCINELKDKSGNLFRIPNYCINDPYFEKIITIDDEKSQKIPEKISVNLYNLYLNKYYKVEIYDTFTGKDIKQLYCKLEDLNSAEYKIRLLFGGAEVADNHELYKHNVKNDYTIQILILKNEIISFN